MEDTNLNNNKFDTLTLVLKSAASIVPYIGAPIAEIIGTVIPNQRLDRIVSFIENLRGKVDDIENKINKRSKTDPSFLDFFEDELLQVGRATTGERINYLSNLLICGINADQADLLAAKQLLRLLGQLNDAEIIWLNYYYIDLYKRKDFIEKNPVILNPIITYQGMSEKDLQASIIQRNYKQRLEELHLIETKIEFDRKTAQAKLNIHKDAFENQPTRITPLGRQLIDIITIQKNNSEG